jgi:hypothetical protein
LGFFLQKSRITLLIKYPKEAPVSFQQTKRKLESIRITNTNIVIRIPDQARNEKRETLQGTKQTTVKPKIIVSENKNEETNSRPQSPFAICYTPFAAGSISSAPSQTGSHP